MNSDKKTSTLFINSLPKSGTHLLISVIDSLGYRNAASNLSIFRKAARKVGFGPPRYYEYETLNKHKGLAIEKKLRVGTIQI